jgi:sugar phosphate isomerase/epimerase
LLHLKDKAKDAPVQYTEDVPRTAFKEVGSGVLDFPAILKAAPAAGVKHYFVEQDQTPGDPLDSLRKSFEYLKTV